MVKSVLVIKFTPVKAGLLSSLAAENKDFQLYLASRQQTQELTDVFWLY